MAKVMTWLGPGNWPPWAAPGAACTSPVQGAGEPMHMHQLGLVHVQWTSQPSQVREAMHMCKPGLTCVHSEFPSQAREAMCMHHPGLTCVQWASQLSTGLALSWGGAGARSGGKFGTVTVGLLLSHPDGGAGIMATLII